MEKIIGIVGGLETETSCHFCLEVNNSIKKITEAQPRIFMENVPISHKALNIIARGGFSAEVLGLLVDSVKRLNKVMVDVIVIPCNTVHVFIEDLRKLSDVPILSIIEETEKECKNRNFKKVGVIGSTTTIKEELYLTELQKQSIEMVIPSKEDQHFVSECIINIVNQNITQGDKQRMIEIIAKMKEEGADAIILGCTDLFLIINREDVVLPLVNSTQVLEEGLINWLKENRSEEK
jgi:aspartate racemase